MRFFSRYRVAVLCAGLILALTAAVLAAQQRPAANTGSAQSMVERGRYLVTVQDCNGCHTPFVNGEPDLTRRLQGHPQEIKISSAPKLPPGWSISINDTNTAWAGPWGVSFTSNLTSDKATGIGGWTEERFIYAIRHGKSMGIAAGHTLMPPMPWKMYSNLTDADLKAIFAYLKTVPPISNKVPSPLPPPKQ